MESTALKEEIIALESIFGESLYNLDKSGLPSPGVNFNDKERSLKYFSEYLDGILEIKISIPFGYPLEASSFCISSWYFDVHYLTNSEKLPQSKNISLTSNTFKQLKELIETRVESKTPILFEIIDILISCNIYHEKYKTKSSIKEQRIETNHFDQFDGDEIFGVTHGEPIIDRKSVFQAHACKVETVEQVKKVIKWLLSNPKIAKATHNIWSYRIFKEKNFAEVSEGSFPIGYDIISQDHNSDGENAAGGRLQHLLEITNAKNVFVMVSRWYGGIQLGPDRFKHINNAARLILEKSGLITRSGTFYKPQSNKIKKNKI
ncbi:Impact family with RWD domain [Cryptosporidium tyzzeri]|nr:Impact family with RWD domain [Cryptosporidium tyzzeri]